MRTLIRKADIFLALMLGYFLIWGRVLAMPTFSWGNVGRLVFSFLLLLLMLETVLVLLNYLRGKPTFGVSRSAFFSWRRALPVSVVVSALYALYHWLMLTTEVAYQKRWVLLVLTLGGIIVLLLYFYSLVQKPDDQR